MHPTRVRSPHVRIADALLVVGAIALLILFTTRYLMAFRLDDVLHMEWARTHTFFQAWDPIHGSIVRSFRPVFAATIWLLWHTAGTSNYFPWHVTLVGSFLIGLAFAGRTSRYLSGESSALYFTVLLYWLAFLPILNVLFWYGDLTFTLELMLITPAWYFGLRGILEAKLRLLIIGLICGIFAVMAKEPAIVLVHGVLVGAVVFRWREVRALWRMKKTSESYFAMIFYLLFLAITIFILLASDTRSNRFFDFHASNPLLFSDMLERDRYYSSILLRLLPRLLLLLPIFYGCLFGLPFFDRVRKWKASLIFLFALLLALVSTRLETAALLLAFSIAIGAIYSRDKRAIQLLLPFAASAVITMAVLTITIMIVKTQLTELAIVLLVLSGWGWSRVWRDLSAYASTYFRSAASRRILLCGIGAGVVLLAIVFAPSMLKQEALLGNVRDVRNNANDAAKWSAANLPKNALLAMPGYKLYGYGRSDDLSQADDATKIGSQYVFHGGYVFIYLNLLGRPDIASYPLEDSLSLQLQLDSLRNKRAYLFLQSELDHRKFETQGATLLTSKDSLLKAFTKGGFHSEIWQLRK